MFSKFNQVFSKSLASTSPTALLMVVLFFMSGMLAACNTSAATPEQNPAETTESNYAGKRILWVDSYHEGYEWSDGVETGLQKALNNTGIEVKYVRMDTKNNPEEAFGQDAAIKAKAEIEAFKPDVLIATDDNAQKYLVVPYYKDSEMRVVFAGVNWDASIYGYPTSNVTGMVEVELPTQLAEHLRNYAQGEKIGYLSVDTETERKIASTYNERFFDGQMKEYWVNSYDEFQEQFLAAQSEVDILFLGNNAGIDRWDPAEAEAFTVENTKIPTGTVNDWMAPYALITLAKSPQEQGEWAGQSALQILNGTPVSEIPVAENKKGELILNLNIAEKLGVVFTPTMLRNAQVYAPEEGSP